MFFDISKWFKKDQPIDLTALQSLEKDELLKIAKENKIDADDKAEKNALIEAIRKFVEQKKLEDEAKENKPKDGKNYSYKCFEDCVYLGKFRKEGDILVLPEKKEVPHFKFVEEENK